LAAFLVSPLRAAWAVAAGLGRRFQPGSGKLPRAALVIPIALRSIGAGCCLLKQRIALAEVAFLAQRLKIIESGIATGSKRNFVIDMKADV